MRHGCPIRIFMKPVHSQNQPLWFKVLSGFLGLMAALASAFCVFGFMRLDLFPRPLSIALGVVIALLMVILIAMQFALTTSTSSKIGISLLTLVVTLVMSGASLFFFQEAGAIPSWFSSSSSFLNSSLSSQSFSVSQSRLLSSQQIEIGEGTLEEQLEDGMLNFEGQDSTLPTTTSPIYVQDPLDPSASTSSATDNNVVVDTPLYVPDGDDPIYVDEPLYIPPEGDDTLSTSQDSTFHSST